MNSAPCPRCAELETDREHLRAALDSRDLIGQAKGIVMATTGCTADEAFRALVARSQREHRKLHVIAAELADPARRAGRRPSLAALRGERADLTRSELHLDLHWRDHDVTIELDGDLDATTVHLLEQALAVAAPARNRVAVDLAGLGFADLRGLRPLVEIRDVPGTVRLRNAPRFVLRLLAMNGLLADGLVEPGSARPAPRPDPAAH